MSNDSKSLVECLRQIRPIEPEIYDEAEKESQLTNVPVEELLIKQGIVSDTDMALAMADYLDLHPLSLTSFTPDPTLVDLMEKERWKGLNALPICKLGSRLTLAMADPFDIVARDEISSSTGLELVPVIALQKEIGEVIESFSNDSSQALEDILKDMAEEGDVEVGQESIDDANLDEMVEGAGEAPVIRIVNSILIEALRKHASDIHIEPMEKHVRLRNRIDGVLYENPSPPKNLQNAIISRLKIMSNLDIAERRVPQDGRFKIRALGKEVDVRVSMLPTVHGEKIVMRILDKTALAPSLDALGLDQLSLDNFSYALSQPYGMILVTGPTGSGKTTTLYSCLQEMNKVGTNIITTENPVEYQLDGINQVQINPTVGLTFAAALR